MGIFNRKKIRIEDIVSAVIIERTQNYSRRPSAGLVFGESLFNPKVMFTEGNAEPAGTTYTFSVTLKDGSKEIVKANSGTSVCDQLLQKTFDNAPGEPAEKPHMPQKAPKLQTNQLTQGIYKVGEDIPAGIFDFHHVWGSGSIFICKAKESTLGNVTFSENVGDTYPYEKTDCIHVVCENGWYLHIMGNLIVSISRSKNIELDL